jgi:hypothetical protein
MTRKHFRAIAEVVSEIKDPAQRRLTCLAFVVVLCQFNSNFNSYRFMEACGLEE